MRRAALALFLMLAPLATAAQLDFGSSTRGISPSARPGVDEALRRTVSLVLRAEARRGGLPDYMTDPEPLPEELLAQLVVGAKLPQDFPATATPANVDRRLPHAWGGSIWFAAGTALIEVDPVRLTILTVAPDVLPPNL